MITINRRCSGYNARNNRWHPPTSPAVSHVVCVDQPERLGPAPTKHSQLPGVAIAGGGGTRHEVRRGVRGEKAGRLVLRELFAGKATLTQCWRRHGGHALEPVEVFTNPHTRDGYCQEHDLLRPEVRALHLSKAKQGPENVDGWLLRARATVIGIWRMEDHEPSTNPKEEQHGRSPSANKKATSCRSLRRSTLRRCWIQEVFQRNFFKTEMNKRHLQCAADPAMIRE